MNPQNAPVYSEGERHYESLVRALRNVHLDDADAPVRHEAADLIEELGPALDCAIDALDQADNELVELRQAFIADEHIETNGKTLLDLVNEVLEDRASLKLRLEQAEYLLHR